MFRRLLLAMALAISATLFVPPTQAHAAGQEITICYPVGFGAVEVWNCHTVVVPEVKPNPPGPVECLSCPPAFDIRDNLDVQHQWWYLDHLGQGMSLLGEAAQADGPKAAEELRLAAAENFLMAGKILAELLGEKKVELDRVGWADLKNQKFFEDPTPTPVLEAIGKYQVEGLILMQLAAGDPSPQPSIEAAMDRFDKAYEELSGLYAG